MEWAGGRWRPDQQSVVAASAFGEPSGARLVIGCQDRSLSVHGWRSEKWNGDEGGVG